MCVCVCVCVCVYIYIYTYTFIPLGPGSIFFSWGKEVTRRQFKIQKTLKKKKQLQKTFLIIVSGYNLNGLPWVCQLFLYAFELKLNSNPLRMLSRGSSFIHINGPFWVHPKIYTIKVIENYRFRKYFFTSVLLLLLSHFSRVQLCATP